MPIFYTFIRYKSNKTKMKKKTLNNLTTLLLFVSLAVLNSSVSAQQLPVASSKSEFWQKVQFGGGLGLTFGQFTNITIAPSAIYNVNQYVGVGVGLLGSYVSNRGLYKATVVGGSIISLFNPVPEVQLSLEVEQLNVNATQNIETVPLNSNGTFDPSQVGKSFDVTNNFWTTALFIGGGYNLGNVTVGGRYNVLFDKNKSAYSAAFIPFVRVLF